MSSFDPKGYLTQRDFGNEESDQDQPSAFDRVNSNNRVNKGVWGSIEVDSERRRKFRDIGDLSVMLPPHKQKMKWKASKFQLKRPDTFLDGSSPYAEYLP